MLSLIMALMAMAIDLMLSAFDEMRATFGLDPTSNDVAGVVAVFHGVRSRSICVRVIESIWSQTNSRGEYCDLRSWSGCVALASLGLLLAARFVWGIGAAGSVVATAVVRDLFSVEMAGDVTDHGRVHHGSVIAPALAPGIAFLPWQSVFWACALWSVALGCGRVDCRKRCR